MKPILSCIAASLAAASVIAMLPAQSAQGQTYKVLYSFQGGADGAKPGDVIRDANGNLYGAASGGGDTACQGGCGTVFKLSKTGKETVLYSFTSGLDGANPDAVIRDAQGNLYGTTYDGGPSRCLRGFVTCGVVFKLDKTGRETVLHRFTGGADGGNPTGLIQGLKGTLYGTTSDGGMNCHSQEFECGVVFKLSKQGKETVLYSFTGGSDGGSPGSLIEDAKGNFYGVTFAGGASNDGTVFKLSETDKETVLYTFIGGADGALPSGVIQDAQGNLYGTAARGGDTGCDPPDGCGVVFKLDQTGEETVLYTFTGGADGAQPLAGVIRDAKGNLYGTTFRGGDLSCPQGNGSGCGVVFELSQAGEETVLHTFTGGADGWGPEGGLIADEKGRLYGTTIGGGTYDCGTVFELTP